MYDLHAAPWLAPHDRPHSELVPADEEQPQLCSTKPSAGDEEPRFAFGRASERAAAALERPLLSQDPVKASACASALALAPITLHALPPAHVATCCNYSLDRPQASELSLVRKALLVLRNPDAVTFFCIAVLMGYGMGTIDSFLFLFLDELGARPRPAPRPCAPPARPLTASAGAGAGAQAAASS